HTSLKRKRRMSYEDSSLDMVAPISRHLIAPAWAAWESSSYLRHFRHLRRTQFDAPGVIRERQLAALRDIVAHARATVPFYRDLPNDIRSFDDVASIPILTKQHI